MQDVRGNDKWIGGVTLVISGDFRQTLPVVPRGTPGNELKDSIKSSYLWDYMQSLHLRTNMRVALYNDLDSGSFSQLLLKIGDGELRNTDGLILIPHFPVSVAH